jgi:hypothetical protein
MWKDPIIEELQQLRDEYAKQFNYDLKAMFEDIKAKERQNTTNPIASLPVQKWKERQTETKPA